MRMLIWLILIYVGFKIVKGFIANRKTEEPVAKPGEEAVRDPVCGVYVAKDDAIVGTVEGERIYFCSMECLEKYRDQLEHK
ncbi:transcriptional regulator [Geobacter pelophilus]|uniref:Transcriptional regulator n=1 Tax=Geoanaerobacter pelophilus TaxID=60036 RepID=A0AAW4KZ76_9BACT|nr:transcriptional regulator [Geoanaerobacter pelophilus]MBT0663868.1 transcriptional regulator [Geoanaerobacter pelophilus]